MDCQLCLKTFSTKSNLAKHIKNIHPLSKDSDKECADDMKQKIDELSDKVCLLEKENNDLKNKIIALLEQTCESTKTITCIADKVVDTNNIMAKTQAICNSSTLTTIEFLKKYYRDAPCLEKTTPDIFANMLMNNNKGVIIEEIHDISQDEQLATILIKKFRADKLEKFIIEGILWYYKKENPKDQSIWSSDTSRMIFLVKVPVGVKKQTISKWITDKNGDELKDYVIEPILDNIKEIFNKYNKICIEKMDNIKLTNSSINKIKREQDDLTKMLYIITDKTFPRKLLSGLISEFDIKKNPKIEVIE